jgi:hypothetical protein
MPKIFEIFGFPISSNTQEAQSYRKAAKCPFMNCQCDGGGNRFASDIDLTKNPALQNFFNHKDKVPSGICSIQLNEHETPWIVCPRRLLVLGRADTNFESAYQNSIEAQILKSANFPQGTILGVWAEVKLKLSEISDDEDEPNKSFHYSFDYVLMPIASISEVEIVKMLGENWAYWRKILTKAGYVIARRSQLDYVEDFPVGTPYIIEIMTSSTSGGNKDKRTTIPQSFEDAILGRPHNAPSINKRQVWARMVSQLIVKSEVALHWGGKALWLLQDNLADYISASTALDLNKFISQNLSEVNILSFGYDKFKPNQAGAIELVAKQIFSGPISANNTNTEPSFSDVIRTAFKPPIKELIAVLVKNTRINTIVTP